MDQIAVIGLGQFGRSIALSLGERDYEVLAIDKEKEKIQNVKQHVTHAVIADATNKDTLLSLGLNNFDKAVVSIGNNKQANILATLLLKELGIPLVIAKAQDQLHGKLLSKLGADKVVYPERDMGHRIARTLLAPDILDYIEFAPDYGFLELKAPNTMAGKNLEQLGLRKNFDVNVLGIKNNGDINLTPGSQDKIQQGDTLIIMGKKENLETFKQHWDFS